jgi:aldose sugar dehydrogenase
VVILATGDAAFYLVKPEEVFPLAIPAPFDRAGFLADWDPPQSAPRLRLTGAELSRDQLFVAHQAWHPKKRCFTMQLSAIAISWRDRVPSAAGDWKRVFESSPCLAFGSQFDDSETGGRLRWTPDGNLLLTVGSHGFAGLSGAEPLAQTDSDYGKIHLISPDGSRRQILSKGHKNPQGITIAPDGGVWAVEHGPQGGDELNLIIAGRNYGWPLVTYGTEYGSTAWPLDPNGNNHGDFEEPKMVFVPAIAPSPLIAVQGEEFPQWRGDLLIGSLRTQSLFRTRLKDDRVIYTEPIQVGKRVRDLAQSSDGKILIWADKAGEILEVSRSKLNDAFDRFCKGCHAPAYGIPAGPPLEDVYTREIASVGGFAYSPGLATKHGKWTEDNLRAFLADPERFAPGTTMRVPGLNDKSREEVIERLTGNSFSRSAASAVGAVGSFKSAAGVQTK